MDRDHRPMLEQNLALHHGTVHVRFVRRIQVDKPGLRRCGRRT